MRINEVLKRRLFGSMAQSFNRGLIALFCLLGLWGSHGSAASVSSSKSSPSNHQKRSSKKPSLQTLASQFAIFVQQRSPKLEINQAGDSNANKLNKVTTIPSGGFAIQRYEAPGILWTPVLLDNVESTSIVQPVGYSEVLLTIRLKHASPQKWGHLKIPSQGFEMIWTVATESAVKAYYDQGIQSWTKSGSMDKLTSERMHTAFATLPNTKTGIPWPVLSFTNLKDAVTAQDMLLAMCRRAGNTKARIAIWGKVFSVGGFSSPVVWEPRKSEKVIKISSDDLDEFVDEVRKSQGKGQLAKSERKRSVWEPDFSARMRLLDRSPVSALDKPEGLITTESNAGQSQPATKPESAEDLYARTKDSVFRIETDAGVGTGFLIKDPDETADLGPFADIVRKDPSVSSSVVTCAHVLNGASTIKVIGSGDALWAVSKVKVDKVRDVALLTLDRTTTRRPLQFASDKPSIGSRIYVIGNPLGFLTNTLSEGIVGGLRDIEGTGLVQISAPY